jgi:hypothetical protein
MVEQSFPPLKPGHAALAGELVPGDEVESIYGSLRQIWTAYLRAVPASLGEADIEVPPEQERLDAEIRKALVALAKSNVVSPLTKMSWTSYAVLSDNYALTGHEEHYLVVWIIHRRLHTSDFFLTEYRRLKDNEESKRWTVTVTSPDGKSVVQRERVFPMWGLEVKHGLDNYQKAKAWYRAQLIARKIVTA